MPVEDLGLAVFIDGFRKFEKQMDEMDKSIDALDEEWKDVDKSSRKAAKGMDEVEKSAKKTSKTQEILTGALRRVGEGVIGFIKNVPRMVAELAKLGASSLRQRNSLDNLAQAAGTSGDEIVSAIQGASDFTIDRMTAMASANKAMLLDVAKSPEQFEKLTKVATRLGRAMGLDAARSIDDFVTAAGRQSIMIADNLGLTIKAGEAYKTYAKALGITTKEMTAAQKKQAFLNAMLEAGEIKVGELGEGSLDAAGSMERLAARTSDLKTALAEKLAPAAATVADVLFDVLTATERVTKARKEQIQRIDDTSKSYDQYIKRLVEAKESGSRADQVQAKQAETMLASGKSIDEVAERLDLLTEREWLATRARVAGTDTLETATEKYYEQRAAIDTASEPLPEWKQRVIDVGKAHDEVAASMAVVEDVGGQAQRGMEDLREEMVELDHVLVDTSEDGIKLAESLAEAEAAAIEMGEAALDMGRDWKTFFADVEESALDFADKREEAEAEHLENIATLQGEHRDTELAAEKLRYEDELLLIEQEQAKQEESQRQSLGRMVLQAFDAWAAMKQIPADRMLEMRLAISEEYGLIDEDAKATTEAMIGTWEAWADDTSLSADRAISAFDNITLATQDLKRSIDAIPRTIDIDARFSAPDIQTGGPGFTFQKGTMFVPRTGLALLHKGEAVLPQHVATVLRQSAGNVTNNITNQGAQNEFNFTAQSLMQPGQMQMEFSTMAMRNR